MREFIKVSQPRHNGDTKLRYLRGKRETQKLRRSALYRGHGGAIAPGEPSNPPSGPSTERTNELVRESSTVIFSQFITGGNNALLLFFLSIFLSYFIYYFFLLSVETQVQR